jgi:hypothetical protein
MSSEHEQSSYDAVRRHPRISANILVRVYIDGRQSTAARGHDVGAAGMAVYAPIELAIGTPVNLSLQLPNSKIELGIRAIVRNRNGFRYGVEFVELTPTEVQEIEHLISLLKLSC